MRKSCTVSLAWKLLLMLVICWAPLAGAADGLAVHAYRSSPHELGKKGLWAVMLRFNYPVFPSNVAEATKVTVDGVQKKFNLLESDSQEKATAATATLLLVPTEASDKPGSATITISKGLSDASGRQILAKDFTYQLQTFEIVSIRGISTFYQSKKERGLRVSLSSQVPERDLAKCVEIHPAVEKLSVTRDRGSNYLISGQFELDKDYVLKISPKAVNYGAAILEEREYQFKGPGVKPHIAVNSDRRVIELRSRQLLPLNISNVTKVRCKMVKVPPLLSSDISEALATAEGVRKLRLKDKVAEFKQLTESSKANPLFVGQVREDAVAFVNQEGKEESSKYSLPLSFRKNPEQGGTWIVSFSDPDYRDAELTKKLIQITDLSVSYKISSEMLLVWVTSIYEGQPVPGAEVLLIDSDGRRYFAGKTDKNGLLRVKGRDKIPAMEGGKFATAAVDTPADLAKLTWIQAVTTLDGCACTPQ